MNPCGRPQTSMSLATGNLMTPAINVDTTLVVAVKECSKNALVTYASRLPDICCCSELTKKIKKIL